jgi:hypothetical protein
MQRISRQDAEFRTERTRQRIDLHAAAAQIDALPRAGGVTAPGEVDGALFGAGGTERPGRQTAQAFEVTT